MVTPSATTPSVSPATPAPVPPDIPGKLKPYVDRDLNDPRYGTYPRHSWIAKHIRPILARGRLVSILLSVGYYAVNFLGRQLLSPLLNGKPIDWQQLWLEVQRVVSLQRLVEAFQARPLVVIGAVAAAVVVFSLCEIAHRDLTRENKVKELRSEWHDWKNAYDIWLTRHDHHRAQPPVPLALASQLSAESLQLGDTDAARFPYKVEFVQDAYDTAVRALQEASQGGAPKKGIVIFGHRNAGKTRLAFEVLQHTLPNWLVLRWGEFSQSAFPQANSADLLGRNYVVLVDDLQDYATENRAGALRTFLETAWSLPSVTNQPQTVLVVATCRTEERDRAAKMFNWLFEKLGTCEVPTFSADPTDPKAQRIISEFKDAHAKHTEEFDGTIGSLVLGLGRKTNEYEAMAEARHPAATVLNAMKLLTMVGITGHTGARVKATSAGVFGARTLQEDEQVWREAMDELTRRQFVDVLAASGGDDVVLRIRKSDYFDICVSRYPPAGQPAALDQDRGRLEAVLVRQADADGLLDVARTYMDLARNAESVRAVEEAITVQPEPATLYAALSLGLTFASRHNDEWATTIYGQVTRHSATSGDPFPGEVASACQGLLGDDGRTDNAALALAYQHALANRSGETAEFYFGLAQTTPEGSDQLEFAIALHGDSADGADFIRQKFAAISIYALGQPAGEITATGDGTESDLLHFAIDGGDGKERIMMPAFTDLLVMREALLRNPEWQTLMVLLVAGGALIDNLDEDVTVVIDPWSRLEYQLPVQTTPGSPRRARSTDYKPLPGSASRAT